MTTGSSSRKAVVLTALTLVGVFAFRLAFGLSSEFFFEDETQVYLIGLRYFATGQWPYFGADVVWTKSEIPGALQGLLVGLPLRIAPWPEAPFVLLNLLSFAALAAFAWYVTRRLPSLPRWLVWGWFMTVPWTLQFSTHIINPSYVLAGAVVFFIGFFEAVPTLSLGLVGPAAAFLMMGAGLMWVMQLHMSWPLLLPYSAWAFWSRRSTGARSIALDAAAYSVGVVIPGLLLLPTIVTYGVTAGSGGVGRNLHLSFENPSMALTTLARLLSFASLEINRFIATDGAKRLEFFLRHVWLIPLAGIVWAVGIVQPVWMLAEVVRSPARWPRPETSAHWRAMRWIILASVVMVYASYCFVMEPAQAHAFYVLAPIALCLAGYCWTFIDSVGWRTLAGVILAINVAFHAGLAIAQAPEKSLYKHRDIVVDAIQTRRPDVLAHRRPFAIDAGPYAMGAETPHDPPRDIVVERATFSRRPGTAVHWSVMLANQNRQVAYRDILYFTTYRTAGGQVIERHEFIKDIFKTCESRVVELNDGYVGVPFENATFRVVSAEALRPSNTGLCDSPSERTSAAAGR
ncbi:MAG TPA: hypothetical protein VF219_00625 [Vicinamibacterales bacterium]